VKFTVANVGDASSGQFDVKVQFSDRTVTLPNAVPGGLAADDEQVLFAATTPGRSCFRTNCTICVTVDSGNVVEECNEENNKMCETTLG
jgi:subtilase family serine protease